MTVPTQQGLPTPSSGGALTPFRQIAEPTPRPSWKRWLGLSEGEKARQMLERMLALAAPMAPDQGALSEISVRFGVGGRRLRALLREAFTLALRHAVRDEHLDPAEIAYLQRLKPALGISDNELRDIEKAVLHPIYERAAQDVIADDVLSAGDRTRLDQVMQDLRLDPIEARRLYDQVAGQRLNTALTVAIGDGRLSPAEETALQALARNLGASLAIDTTTQATLERMRLLWRIENGQLPVVAAPINLQRNENCHAVMHAAWHEPRTRTERVGYHGFSTSVRICKGVRYRIGNVKPITVSREVIVLVDEGTLYLTNKRLVFVGAKRNMTVRLSSLLGFTPYSDGIELDKSSGRPPLLRLSGGDTEIFHAVLSAALAAA